MADKGSDGLGTGDSGYFSRRLPRGVYGSSNYPSYDREDSSSSRSGSLRSRLSDDIRPHSPLRRSDGITSSSKPPTGRDSSLRDSLKSSYSSPYSSLTSEPSLTRTSSSYTRSPRDTTTTYTSPYSPSHESSRSTYLRSEPRASDQYLVRDGDRPSPKSSYLRDDLPDRSTPAYPEGYSSLSRRRVPFRLPDDAGTGAVTYERMEPAFVRGTRSVYEPHQVGGPYEPAEFDEGLGGYTSLPYNVYELSETVPVLIESPRTRVYDHPLVDYPVDRRELGRTYSELGPLRGGEEDSTSRSPIMRKRGGTYYGHAQPGDTRADRIRQRYGGTDSSPSAAVLREEYPGSLREYPGSIGRSVPRAIRDEVSDTIRSNLSDPGVRSGDDYDAGVLPGVPLPPNRAPPSYHDVLSDGGKKYTPLRQNSSDSLRSSVSGSSRADTGNILRRSQSQQDKDPLKKEISDVEDRYRSPSSTASRKDFQQTRSSSKDQPDDSRPSPGGASNRAKFSKSRSSSRGSFDEDPGSGRRVRFGGFFDDFDRPSLFGRRGRSLFDAFDFNDEREKRRAKFRDMFDDQLSLLGRHRGLFNDWDPFDRSRSGSPQQRSDSGSPRSCSSPADMPRSDSPKTSKTTIISETSDPKEGKKVVEITETSSPKTGRKRRTIKETKTSSLDAGDGTRRTVTETKTETIEPNDKECEKDAPCDKSWKPIDERNLFDKYKFKFGSFGEFGSGKTGGRETLNFRDFDDLVDKFKNLHRKSRAEVQKEEESDKEHEKEKDNEENKTEEKKDVPKTEETVEQKNNKVDEQENKKVDEEQNQNQKVEKDEKNKKIKVEQTTNEESNPEDKQSENTESKPTEKVEESDKPCNCQYTCHHKCRQLVSLDCTSLPDDEKKKLAETTLTGAKPKVDDADSGYHTGESTLQATPAPAPHVPSERTLTRDDLRRRIDAFNNNQHGLLMTLQEETLTFQGFIRVHMNLMRPISMTLPMRPPSIYDVISSDGEASDEEGGDHDTLTTSFYLPKDTTKVIHITSTTTTSEVIRALLQKFKITDNPRKFALYEKIYEGDKSTMRRMVEDEFPLPLCLSWSSEGLDTRRFVLQENDTGEIIWDEFSIPELENFLRILDREEEEYVEQVKARYSLLRIQMQKEMNAIEEEEKDKELFDKPEDKPPDPPNKGGSNSDKTLQEDKREPVFV